MEPENYGDWLNTKYKTDNGDFIECGDWVREYLEKHGDWTKTIETDEEKKLRIRKERINNILSQV